MPTERLSRRRLLAYGMLLLATLCWGSTLIPAKIALVYVSPFRLLLYRYIFAALFTLPIVWRWLRKRQHSSGVLLRRVALVELIGTTAALGLLYSGLERMHAIGASLIVTTQPLFAVVLGVILLKERLEHHELVGALCSFVGAVLLAMQPMFVQDETHLFSLIGVVMIFGHNILASVQALLAKRYYHRVSKMLVSSLGYWVGLCSFAVLSFAEHTYATLTTFGDVTAHQPFTIWSLIESFGTSIWLDLTQPVILAAAVFMAVVTSIIGLAAYLRGLDLIEVSEASLFWYLEPLVYLPLGVLVLHDKISIGELAALAIIVAGVAFAKYRRGVRGKG